jgi:hypothetical protein
VRGPDKKKAPEEIFWGFCFAKPLNPLSFRSFFNTLRKRLAHSRGFFLAIQ